MWALYCHHPATNSHLVSFLHKQPFSSTIFQEAKTPCWLTPSWRVWTPTMVIIEPRSVTENVLFLLFSRCLLLRRSLPFFLVQRRLFETRQGLEKRSREGKWQDTIINLEEGEDTESHPSLPALSKDSYHGLPTGLIILIILKGKHPARKRQGSWRYWTCWSIKIICSMFLHFWLAQRVDSWEQNNAKVL